MSEDFKVDPHTGPRGPTVVGDHPPSAHDPAIIPAEGVFARASAAAHVVVLGAEDRMHNVEIAAEMLLHHRRVEAVTDAGRAADDDTIEESPASTDTIVVNPFHHAPTDGLE